ncbi:MAG: 3-dehydroquinate synthase [Bacillota bacterium]|nr:3-dehydroquinate synthase [Bacillota bacterium]
MKTINCRTNRKPSAYDIHICKGVLDKAGIEIKEIAKGKKTAIISDSNVAPLYANRLSAALRDAGFEADVFIFTAGEQSKNFGTINNIYTFLEKFCMTRADTIIALGGGVTGDMAGFAAATFLRGVRLVQIPTTLLACVDSSVGGKTGYDLPEGKNHVGAFYQPSLVLIDPDVLDTLPRGTWCDGMAEVIKYAFIRDPALFDKLAAYKDKEEIEDIIETCVRIKSDVVEADELDTGIRGILNFGHTFGHAAEKIEHYTGITHGSAVAAGMVMAAAIGEYLGLTERGTKEKIISLNKKFSLPISFAQKPLELFSALTNDKKNLNGVISLVMLKKTGEAFLWPVELSELKSIMNEAL